MIKLKLSGMGCTCAILWIAMLGSIIYMLILLTYIGLRQLEDLEKLNIAGYVAMHYLTTRLSEIQSKYKFTTPNDE